MSLGKKLFEITDTDWARGMSTSDDISDGGFSSVTDAVNLIAQPGVAYAPAQPTDKSTNVADNVIASCSDASGTYDRLYVGDAGKFYGWNGTTMAVVATDSTRIYTAGKTDISPYGPYAYGTSTTYVFEWAVSSGTVNQTYFAFPTPTGLSDPSTVPHPCLTFEGNIYYGNGPQLLRQTLVGGVPAEILYFTNYGETIQALSIDSGSGKMLISTTSGKNASDTLNKVNRVHYYDGFSNKTLKTVIVDEMVTAFYPNGNYIYLGYGQNLGIWSGSGIEFLRKLDNVSLSNTDLLYKHHFSNIGSTLYVIDGTQILALGPVRQRGDKVFYYAYKNNVNGNKLSLIANIGAPGGAASPLISIAFAANKFYTWSATDVSTSNTQNLQSNSYEFDNEYWIRWARVIWKNQVNNNVDPGSIRFRDQDGINPVNTLYDLKNSSGAPSAFKDILNINAKMKQAQVEMILDIGNAGIRRIIVYGEPANITP